MILFLFFLTLFYLWLMRLLAAGKNLDDFDVTMAYVVEVLHQRMTSAVMDSSARCGITFNATRKLWRHLLSVSWYRTVCYYL
ncbi:hypothetical protein C8J56DRAFT_982269 [Mycena floridula]|nr:hypothetical protein C8J56DRAFT_982269 [Mycena floridula]